MQMQMRSVDQDEKEIELLLNEIPHHHHRDVMLTKPHGGSYTYNPHHDVTLSRAFPDFHACFSPLSSDGSNGSNGSGSGSLSGTVSPRTEDYLQPDLGMSVRDQINLLHRLQSMNLSSNSSNYNVGNYNRGDQFGYFGPNFGGGLVNYGCNGSNLPVNYSVNDGFGMANLHYSVNDGFGNLRDFEGLFCNNNYNNNNNGGSIGSRINPVKTEMNQGFVPFQYGSISDALIQSQIADLHSNYNRNLNPNPNFNLNPLYPNYGSVLAKSRYSPDPIEAFKCEESLIIQGNSLNPKPRKTRGNSVNFDIPTSPSKLTKLRNCPSSYESLMGVKGYLHLMARDQHGCRFLQAKFEEGKSQIDVVFEGVVGHAMELMVNQFGNYLMQKLLEVCDEEQRMRVVGILTEDPARLVRVSLNVHGTRVVQKLIETLGNKRQVSMVIAALKPGFLDLMKDLNGNHVVQQCLQSLKPDDNKFIFDAAATHCVDIATHQHGCCVLQRCIACSSSENRAKLVAQVSSNGFLLAQDAFGNYVVQFVLDLKIPSANSTFAAQFEGKYVELAKQKFSSNVVEKCLKIFSENDKAKIVLELLSASRFDQLVQDPYANYVIHTALQTSKGTLHGALVEAIKPHAEVLRTNPHCKRIVSRSLLKK